MSARYPQAFNLDARFELAGLHQPATVNTGSPATDILLDFRLHPALTLLPSTAIDKAQQLLENSHASVLLVADRHHHFCGLLNDDCLLDQSVMRRVNRFRRRTDLQVSDFMVPRDMVSALDYKDLANASVGQIITLLKHERLPSLLVVANDSQEIVGVITAKELAKIFNMPMEEKHTPSFMDIFDAVMH